MIVLKYFSSVLNPNSLLCLTYVTNEIIDGKRVINNRYYIFLLCKDATTIKSISLPFYTLPYFALKYTFNILQNTILFQTTPYHNILQNHTLINRNF